MPKKPDLQLVRDYLRGGRFSPQDRLPPERQLAEQLGLTRSRLRTCLARLEREGVLWRHVGRGTFVGAASGPSSSPSAANSVVDTNPSEILEARLCLEPQIAYLAAQQATGQDVEKLLALIDRSRASHTWMEWRTLDRELHLAIAGAARNGLLLKLLATIQDNETLRNWGNLSEAPAAVARRDEATNEHEKIVHAIAARQAREAALLMRRHLEEVKAAFLGWFPPP